MTCETMARGRYAVAEWWRAGVHIGIVTSVQDPQGLGRVQVQLPAIDPDGDALPWARVAVPFAGDNYGAFFLPDVGSEVLVAFTAGNVGAPVVIGNLWNGATELPEELPGDAVDRWTLTGKNGTRIAIVEQAEGQEKVEIELPSGSVKATLSDAGGGRITLKAGQNTVTVSPAGVTVNSPATIEVKGAMIKVEAGFVQVDAGLTSVSGILMCDALVTNSVISSSYTPGAGNVW